MLVPYKRAPRYRTGVVDLEEGTKPIKTCTRLIYSNSTYTLSIGYFTAEEAK